MSIISEFLKRACKLNDIEIKLCFNYAFNYMSLFYINILQNKTISRYSPYCAYTSVHMCTKL